MRRFSVALLAVAGLLTAVGGSGSVAAAPNVPAVVSVPPGMLQQAQYYPWYRDHYYWYRRHHHHHYYPWWRYSQAEELNRQELRNLGVAP